MKLIHWTLDHPIAVSMFYFAMLIIGIVCFSMIPIELSPNIELPQLTVSAGWTNTSPVTMEAQVTAPLESALQGLKGVTHILSRTYEGWCTITADFEKNANLQLAELELNERISQLKKKLPKGVSWPVIQRSVPEEMRSFEGFMQFQLIGDQEASEIRKFAEEKLWIPLSSIQGIDAVEIRGGEEKIIRIGIDPNAVKLNNLTQSDLSVINSFLSNQNYNAGQVRNSGMISSIRLQNNFLNIEEVKNLPINNLASSTIIRLKDIAYVEETVIEPTNIVRINGCNLVTITLNKESGVNLLETAKRVDESVVRLKKILPSNMELVKETDTSRDLMNELNKLKNRSLLSILFIAIVLFLVFKSVRTSFIIISSLCISILGAVALFYLTGYTLNILTLAGFTMGFGILVDNAIVVYDNIHRKLVNVGFKNIKEEKNRDIRKKDINYLSNKKNAVVQGVQEVAQPLIASNLTTLGAFIPIFFLSSELQMYFKPFVSALGLTLIISLLVSFTLIPTFSFHQLFRKTGKIQKKQNGILNRSYKHTLRFCMSHRGWVIFIVIWLFGFPFWLLPNRIEIKEKEEEVVTIEELTTSNRKAYERFVQQRLSENDQSLSDIESEVSNITESDIQQESSWFQNILFSVRNWSVNRYNSWWGDEKFNIKVKPFIFKVLGGASYRFFREVQKGELWNPFGETTYIAITLNMPNNIHIDKLNHLCQDFENRILEYDSRIKKITANIYSKENAQIRVDIKSLYELTSFPVQLYANLVKYGLNIGGVGITVIGYGPGFMTGLDTNFGQYSVKVTGTNFNTVYDIAESFAEKLSENSRIRNIDIEKTYRWDRKRFEVVVQPDRLKAIQYNLSNDRITNDIRSSIQSYSYLVSNINDREVKTYIGFQDAENTTIYKLGNTMIGLNYKNSTNRFSEILNISKQRVLPEIQRENQTYMRLINYDYIGPLQFGNEYRDLMIKNTSVPYGYSVVPDQYTLFGEKQLGELLWIIILAIIIVWMVCTALFESLKKPFYILLAIPLSIIGLFYSFYFFDATFDRGGYASVLLLIGIVVNNSIILVKSISDSIMTNKKNQFEAIIEAASRRTRPIFLTTITTIVGLLPLVLYESTESIWYALAVGTIGGLVMSSILILIIIPIFITSSKI